MRYDYLHHKMLNESIVQMNEKEQVVRVLESIVYDICERTKNLLESDDFFIEFYADNKQRLTNLLLTENTLTENEFIELVTPLIIEGLWTKIMGEKIKGDYESALDSVHHLANKAYGRDNSDLEGKAEKWRSLQLDHIRSHYDNAIQTQGGLRGFANRLKSKFVEPEMFKPGRTSPVAKITDYRKVGGRVMGGFVGPRQDALDAQNGGRIVPSRFENLSTNSQKIVSDQIRRAKGRRPTTATNNTESPRTDETHEPSTVVPTAKDHRGGPIPVVRWGKHSDQEMYAHLEGWGAYLKMPDGTHIKVIDHVFDGTDEGMADAQRVAERAAEKHRNAQGT